MAGCPDHKSAKIKKSRGTNGGSSFGWSAGDPAATSSPFFSELNLFSRDPAGLNKENDIPWKKYRRIRRKPAGTGKVSANSGRKKKEEEAPPDPDSLPCIEDEPPWVFTETFGDILGLDQHIQTLKEMILWPLLYPDLYKKWNVSPPKGVIFHGPPGTGKTMVAKALVNQYSELLEDKKKRVSFYFRSGADILSKWIGDAEKAMKALFERARETAPSIIFFDEIDGIVPARTAKLDQANISLVNTLLFLMDGIYDRGRVIVIGSTNRLDDIDPALRRPGRFDKELYFGLPTHAARLDLLQRTTMGWAIDHSTINGPFLFDLAAMTDGFCHADIKAMCDDAVIHCFRSSLESGCVDPDRIRLTGQNLLDAFNILKSKKGGSPHQLKSIQGLVSERQPSIYDAVYGEAYGKVRETVERYFCTGAGVENALGAFIQGAKSVVLESVVDDRILFGLLRHLPGTNIIVLTLLTLLQFGTEGCGQNGVLLGCVKQLIEVLGFQERTVLLIPNIDLFYSYFRTEIHGWNVLSEYLYSSVSGGICWDVDVESGFSIPEIIDKTEAWRVFVVASCTIPYSELCEGAKTILNSPDIVNPTPIQLQSPVEHLLSQMDPMTENKNASHIRNNIDLVTRLIGDLGLSSLIRLVRLMYKLDVEDESEWKRCIIGIYDEHKVKKE